MKEKMNNYSKKISTKNLLSLLKKSLIIKIYHKL